MLNDPPYHPVKIAGVELDARRGIVLRIGGEERYLSPSEAAAIAAWLRGEVEAERGRCKK